jgi:hypothetical protein
MSPQTKDLFNFGMHTIRENEKENDDSDSDKSHLKETISEDKESAYSKH